MDKLLFLVVIFFAANSVLSSKKKGICIGPRSYQCNDTNVFHSVSWWYDWGNDEWEHKRSKCTNTPRGEYVPMYWGGSSIQHPLPMASNYLLAFNEPNHKDQSNLSPQRVAELWPQLEKRAGHRKIVSPALAGCSNANACISWFTEFFNHCKNCRVDALAVHAYSCNADGVFHALRTIAHHFGKNLWLTEFACASGKTVNQQIAYMQKILPLLEGASFIERYSWFVNRMHKNSTFINTSIDLLEQNSSTLTKLGKYYDSFTYSGK